MDTDYTQSPRNIACNSLFEKAEKIGLDNVRPEIFYAKLSNKKGVANYKRQLKRNRRNYSIYETRETINGETWLAACCYGEFKNSKINNFLFAFYYHMAWAETERDYFLNAIKDSQKLLIVLLLAFIPYIMNYVFLIYTIINFDDFNSIISWTNFLYIALFIGLFYWPLGVATGYTCLYLMLI